VAQSQGGVSGANGGAAAAAQQQSGAPSMGGMGSMGGMARGGSGGGDKERKSPGYMKGEKIFEVPGDDLPPPVIGEPQKPKPKPGGAQ
jgi:hypothetical protein